MPELLNLLYEQLSYHKILPLEYNLSTKISHEIGNGRRRASLPKGKLVVLRSRPVLRFTAQRQVALHRVG